MEPEEDQPEDLASLGFTSFGSRSKRPKHHHCPRGSNSNLIPLIPPPGAAEVTASTSTTEGAKKKPEFMPYVAPAFTPYVPPRFAGGAGGRGGRTGGGGRDEREQLYSPRFVENPWKALEMKFGIRAEWVDMEKIEGGNSGDEEEGEEVKGEGGDEEEKRMADSAERVEVRMQGKADGFGERGES